jgi:hypothetical protein
MSKNPEPADPDQCMRFTELGADSSELRMAIERMHGGSATLAQSVPVRETFEGKTVWEGVVHVFDLAGHPTATRAYAWPFPAEGSDQLRIVAVLHTARINSPLEAVRAAIVAENRSMK